MSTDIFPAAQLPHQPPTQRGGLIVTVCVAVVLALVGIVVVDYFVRSSRQGAEIAELRAAAEQVPQQLKQATVAGVEAGRAEMQPRLEKVETQVKNAQVQNADLKAHIQDLNKHIERLTRAHDERLRELQNEQRKLKEELERAKQRAEELEKQVRKAKEAPIAKKPTTLVVEKPVAARLVLLSGTKYDGMLHSADRTGVRFHNSDWWALSVASYSITQIDSVEVSGSKFVYSQVHGWVPY